MRWLRQHTAPLAAILVIIFAGQMLDLLVCRDEVREHRHVRSARTADVPVTTQGEDQRPASHRHGDAADSVAPDCVCHIVFTRTDIVPAVAAAPAGLQANVIAAPPAPLSAEPDPLDHVPLA